MASFTIFPTSSNLEASERLHNRIISRVLTDVIKLSRGFSARSPKYIAIIGLVVLYFQCLKFRNETHGLDFIKRLMFLQILGLIVIESE